MKRNRGILRDAGLSNLISLEGLSLLPIWMMHQLKYAQVKFGGGVTAISGSIAGSTFARNRFGYYIRPRTKPVNPRSDRQSAARSKMQLLAAYWSSVAMSAAERGAWVTYAAAIARKNRLGEVMYCTGFNEFIAGNSARMAVGGLLIEAGPTELVLPGADTTIAMTADAGTQLLTVAFDEAQAWALETGGFLSVSMGQPQSVTRNFFGGPYRNAGGIAGIVTTGAQSPATMAAPFTLVTGQKVFAFARIIRADGRTSNPMNFPALTVGGLLAAYHVTGTLSPNITTYNFLLAGAFNGKAYYKAVGADFYIWWDAATKWYISILLGTPGTGYWSVTQAGITGAYAATAPNTGVATVVAGELP